MAFQDKKFLDAEGITHLVRLLDEYPNNQVLGSVIDAIEGELDQKAEKSEIPEVPVQDVQANGQSILNQNGIANVPLGTNAVLGIVKGGSRGVTIASDGTISIDPAVSALIKTGSNGKNPIVPGRQHESTFYGLAKAAGADEKNSELPVGQYTDSAKTAIQQMLDVPSTSAVTSEIATAIGNINSFDMAVVQALPTEDISTHTIYLVPKTGETNDVYDEYVYINNNWEMVGNTQIDLSDYATKDELPDVPVQDVQVNGTSIVNNNIANIPIASGSNLGVIKISGTNGIGLYCNPSTGALQIAGGSKAQYKAGLSSSIPVTANFQHEATFYGLAKAAGHDEKDSTFPLGQYTPEAQSAIRSMIGAANADDIVAVQDTQPTSEDNKIWLPETTPEGVEIPTVVEMNAALTEKIDDVQINSQSIVQNGVANIPVASRDNFGVVKGYNIRGVGVDSAGNIRVLPAENASIKQGSSTYEVITAANNYVASFYGLAKAAGDTTQSQSSNAVGTYTSEAKAAIKTMLGIEENSSSGEVVTPIDDTAGVGDTAKVWSADKTSTEINNIIDTAPTEELATELLIQEETNTYLNERFLSSIHNMFESLPQDEILSEILNGIIDGNSLLRQLYRELEARKLAAE